MRSCMSIRSLSSMSILSCSFFRSTRDCEDEDVFDGENESTDSLLLSLEEGEVSERGEIEEEDCREATEERRRLAEVCDR
jgi:hypothetical protein